MAVAVSGGGDSLALLRLASTWAHARGRRVLALTVDHGLHASSADWTAEAGRAARAQGADWRALAWTGAKPATGLAAAARRARHALLAQAAREAGARVLLMGHTADDRRENEILRAQATPSIGELRAWTPSPVWPEGRDVLLLRPLLRARRAELRDWLVRVGDTWRDDPANEDPGSPRARARRAAWIDPQPLAPLPWSPPPPHTGAADCGVLRWDRDAFATMSDASLRRLLACAAVCVGGGERLPQPNSVDRLLAAAHAIGPTTLTLVGSRVAFDAGGVSLTREIPARGSPAVRREAALPVSEKVVWDGRWAIAAHAPGWSVGFAAGRLARLPAATRSVLGALPPAARPALPLLLHVDGEVRLAPFDAAPGGLDCLVARRFAAAMGSVDVEPASL